MTFFKIFAIIAASLIATASNANPFSLTGDRETYWGAVIGSQHIGATTKRASELNDVTPGLTLGRRYGLEHEPSEVFLEAGVFYNSYEEVSPVFLAGYTTRLLGQSGRELRIGAFTGVGYYRELGLQLKEKHGLPYFEGFIPLIGAALIYRYKNTEYRMTTVPAENLDFILNFSITKNF